ncbi:MAG: hypothetical protein ACR2L2_13005 [Acidobacteriota bacterium]
MSVDETPEYSVCLDIVSDSLTLKELESALSVTGDAGSHNRGDKRVPHGLQRVYSSALLRIEGDTSHHLGIQDQFQRIVGRLPAAKLHSSQLKPSQFLVVFNIAVYFTTASGSVLLPAPCVETVQRYGADLEISSYPCSQHEKATTKG